MPGLSGFTFRNWDPIGSVKSSLDDWSYSQFDKELEAEESLYTHLVERFPRLEIQKEFYYDQIRMDILIERNLAIELKLNLTSNDEYKRLIGQLDSYHRWDGLNMIVLVIGDFKTELQTRLEYAMAKLWDDEESTCIINLPNQSSGT